MACFVFGAVLLGPHLVQGFQTLHARTPATAPAHGSQIPDFPQPTRGAELRHRRVDRRNDNDLTTVFIAPDPTCGFKGGNSDSFVSCGDGFSCAFVTTPGGVQGVACCSNFLDCPAQVMTGCLDSTQAVSSGYCNESGSCSTWRVSHTRLCTDSNMPICQTVLYKEASATGYICGSESAASVQTMLTNFLGQTRVFESITLGPGDEPLETQTATSNEGSGPAANNSDGNEDEPGTSDHASHDNHEDHHEHDRAEKTPAGVIVGGVIGGLAVVAVFALAAVLFLRMKKKKSEEVQSTPEQFYPSLPSSSTFHWKQGTPMTTANTPSHINYPFFATPPLSTSPPAPLHAYETPCPSTTAQQRQTKIWELPASPQGR